MTSRRSEQSRHLDILVLGASFSGLEFVYQLERRGYFEQHPNARVQVVDRVDQTSYLPLIHEEIYEPDEMADPVKVRHFFDRFEQVKFLQATVTEVDFEQRLVQFEDGSSLRAHHLVVALGSVLKVPRTLDPQGLALVLKTGQDRALLRAKLSSLGPKAKIAVIGGGLSGVELAAELAFRQPRTQSVALVHARDELNCGVGERIDRLSQARLRKLGVALHLGARVQSITHDGLVLCKGGQSTQVLDVDLVCWAGGVQGPGKVKWRGAALRDGGWVAVDACLRVWSPQGSAYPFCYAIGDIAAICPRPGDSPVKTMRRAIEAIWQANSLAKVLTHPERARPHPLRLDWPHGVSLGPASLVCYGRWVVDLRGLGRWFRRFLGRMYLRRYHMPPWRRSRSRR